jgi:hypothetical protein
MLSLVELQARFSAALGDGDAAGLAALLAPGLDADAALAIHRGNLDARFVGALADTFPATRRLVGENFFAFAARAYVEAHPCRSGTLLGYGREFPGFLGGFAPAAALPYLADVARLEFLVVDAHHAADAEPADPEALRGLAARFGDALRLPLHPSVRLLRTRYPVLDLWQANLGEVEPPPMRLDGPGERLLILRPRAQVRAMRVSGASFALLAACARGAPLDAALDEAAAAGDGFDRDLAALIAAGSFVPPAPEIHP